MALEYIPRSHCAMDTDIKMTRTSIVQCGAFHACYVARPSWMWGAEIACNEFGVCIGNEAIFGIAEPQHKNEGTVSGMDICRLTAHRATTAKEAFTNVTNLIETLDQGGDCGFDAPFYYHNAFLICDATEAYHIETYHKKWVAKHITSGAYAISNSMLISDDYHLCCPDIMRDNAVAGKRLSWAATFCDAFTSTAACGAARSCYVSSILSEKSGSITLQDICEVLRDHGLRRCRIEDGLTGQDICMHAAAGPVRKSQTTASWVTVLKPNISGVVSPGLLVTDGSAPCLSIYRPLVFPQGADDETLVLGLLGPAPLLTYTQDFARSRWWRHELFHRYAIRQGLNRWQASVAHRRSEPEAQAIAGLRSMIDGTVATQPSISECSRIWLRIDLIMSQLLEEIITGKSPSDPKVDSKQATRVYGASTSLPQKAPYSRTCALVLSALDGIAYPFYQWLYGRSWKAADDTSGIPG